MATFPTLSRGVSCQNLQNQPAFDPTTRTELSAGYSQTTNSVTWVPIRFTRTYHGLTNADKALLDTFQEITVEVGKTNFTWLDEVSSNTYDVVLVEPFHLQMVMNGAWQTTLTFQQYSIAVT